MKYTKPVGATADLRELEYISALHQTGKTLRRDGSIKTDDIAKFLMSRYGIKVTEEEVTETIAKGFGGGDVSEEDGDTLDLVEMTAIYSDDARANVAQSRNESPSRSFDTGDD